MKKNHREPSRHEIWKMFDQISSTYDCVNRIMTFGLDRYWRKKMAEFLPNKPNIYLLDCATGTGDQLLSLLLHSNRIEKAIGIDLSDKMLALAQKKIRDQQFHAKVSLQQASLLEIPFPAETFDCITISFGIRNVTDVMLALKETLRVLKPKGRLLILEGTIPQHPLLKPFFLLYLRHLMPRLGGFFSKNKKAYHYLNQTIETFPQGDNFCFLLKQAGFIRAKANSLMGGAVCIYEGDKGSNP